MKLIDAIRILAATKDSQISYLLEIGTFPSTDELALQFVDTYHVYKGELADGIKDIFVNENIENNIKRINLLFDDMSSIPNNPFWEISALGNPEWEEIRKLARDTLRHMDIV